MGSGTGDWLQGAVSDVGNWAGNNMGTILPLAATLGTSMFSQGQQNQASQQAAMQNQALWRQSAFPNKKAVEASASQNRGDLGLARMGSYNNLANQMAARGFYSGSGLGIRGAENIERGYLQSLGNMQTDLTRFANTPTSPMPSIAYQQPQLSPAGAGANTMSTALGYMQMMNWLRGLSAGNLGGQYNQPNYPQYNSYGNLPSYNPYDYATQDIYSPFYSGGGGY